MLQIAIFELQGGGGGGVGSGAAGDSEFPRGGGGWGGGWVQRRSGRGDPPPLKLPNSSEGQADLRILNISEFT